MIILYTAFIDPSLIKNLLFRGIFEEIEDGHRDAQHLQSKQVKTFILGFIERNSTAEVELSIWGPVWINGTF